MRSLKTRTRQRHGVDRCGSVTVEFALIAPLIVALFMGGLETAFNFDATHKIYASVRQSGRLASMDSSKKLLPGQTANEKVMLDIKNSLIAEGLPGDDATITITHADGSSAGDPFDLSSPANGLKYFRIKVVIPYSALSMNNLLPNQLTQLSASVVFRKDKTSQVI